MPADEEDERRDDSQRELRCVVVRGVPATAQRNPVIAQDDRVEVDDLLVLLGQPA